MTQIKRLTDVVAQTSAEKAHLDRRAALAATPAQALAVPAWPAPAGVPERIALAGGRPLHQVRPTACDECSLPAPYGLPAGNGCGHFHYSCLQRRLATDSGDSDRANRVGAPVGSLRVMDLVERLPEDEDPHRCTVCGADVSGEIPARREPVTVSGWYGPHEFTWRGSRVELDRVRCAAHRGEYLDREAAASRASYEASQDRERAALQARYDAAEEAEAARPASRSAGPEYERPGVVDPGGARRARVGGAVVTTIRTDFGRLTVRPARMDGAVVWQAGDGAPSLITRIATRTEHGDPRYGDPILPGLVDPCSLPQPCSWTLCAETPDHRRLLAEFCSREGYEVVS